MKKLIVLCLALSTVVVVASEADLKRLDHLDDWQWTKDHEVCDAVLQPDLVEVLSPGARASYDKQLKAAVEGYDAWESERKKLLAALTDEERDAYNAKRAKSEAERKSKEMAEKLAVARRQLAAMSRRTTVAEEPAMSELLKLKLKWIDDVGEWANRHLHGLSREVDAYKRIGVNATQDEREISKFKIRLELWDMERDLNRVEMIKSTMSRADLATYEQMQREKDELAKVKNPRRHERTKKASEGRTNLVEEAKAIVGL